MRRNLLLVFTFLLLSAGVLDAQRKKVALVLSGGGAKGVAHIGVLKVLEQVGIPVDMVVGTSMGAIVGGLYAIGYDAYSLDSLVRVQDWAFLLSDKINRYDLPLLEKEQEEIYLLTLPLKFGKGYRTPVGLVRGHNVYNLFTDLTIGYHDSLDFHSLKIPFTCVAADMMTRQEVLLDRGSLALAMRASMAIPGVFTPVLVDSMALVDGGVLNNFPVDVARAMGADVVIGVDVQADLMGADKLNTVSHVVPQLINLLCMNKYEENCRHVDLLIRPDLNEFTAASFTSQAIDTMLYRGEYAALKQREALLKLKRQLGRDMQKHRLPIQPDKLPIRHIVITGVSPQVEKLVRGKVFLQENSEISVKELHRTIAMLYGTKGFSAVNYRLKGTSPYDLELILKEEPTSLLKIGFRFDSEKMAALLLNTTLNYKVLRGSRVSLSGRLSQNPYVRLDYSLDNTFLRRLELSYMFGYNDIDIYQKNHKKYNVTYRYHLGEMDVSSFYARNFKFKFGLRYEYFDYNSFLFSDDGEEWKVYPEGFLSYYCQARLETFDRLYYPSRGMFLQADYTLCTDNFATYKGGAPFSIMGMRFETVLPITTRLSVLPCVQGRVLVGNNIPYPYFNAMGGLQNGRYMPQQFSFYGINHVEIFDHALLVWALKLRQRMGSRHYAILVGNYAQQHDRFGDIWQSCGIWGGGVGYSRDSRIGPIDLMFTLSDWSNRLAFYFNLGFYF